MSTADDDPWLTTKEVAARLRVDPATLGNWRRAEYGPLSARVGGHRLYRESAVAEFERQQIEAAEAERRAKQAS